MYLLIGPEDVMLWRASRCEAPPPWAFSHPSNQISGNGPATPNICRLLATEAGVKPVEFEEFAEAALI